MQTFSVPGPAESEAAFNKDSECIKSLVNEGLKACIRHNHLGVPQTHGVHLCPSVPVIGPHSLSRSQGSSFPLGFWGASKFVLLCNIFFYCFHAIRLYAFIRYSFFIHCLLPAAFISLKQVYCLDFGFLIYVVDLKDSSQH